MNAQTPSARARRQRWLLRGLLALGLMSTVSGCIVVPAYPPPRVYYTHPYYGGYYYEGPAYHYWR